MLAPLGFEVDLGSDLVGKNLRSLLGMQLDFPVISDEWPIDPS